MTQKKQGPKTAPVRKTKKTTAKKNTSAKTAAKKTASKSNNKTTSKGTAEPKTKKTLSPAAFEAACIVAAGFGALVIFSIFFAADTIFGQVMLSVLKGFFGTGAYLFPFALILGVIGLFVMEDRSKAKSKAVFSGLLFVVLLALLHIFLADEYDGFDTSALTGGFTDSSYIGGGFFGSLLGGVCLVLFKKTGSVIILLFLAAALGVLISGKSIIVLASEFWNFISNTVMGGIYEETEYYDDDEYDYYDDEEEAEHSAKPVKQKKAAPKINRLQQDNEPDDDYYEKLRREKSYKNARLVNLKEKTGEKKQPPDIMSRHVKANKAKTEDEKAQSLTKSAEFLTAKERKQPSSDYIPEFLRTERPKQEEEYVPEYFETERETMPETAETGENTLEEGAASDAVRELVERTAVINGDNEPEKAAEPTESGEGQPSQAAETDLPPWEEPKADIAVYDEVKERVKIIEGDDATVKKIYQKKQAEYKYPKLSFLDKNPDLQKQANNKEELIKNSHILEETLSSFKVSATVVEVSQGPTITRYELVPAVGTKVKSIANLDKDLAMRLAAEKIMIEAPIPGKTAVGIEIPNENPLMVYFSEVVASKKFQASRSKLTFALGKDVAGNVIIKDIAKAPHFLIAGATNSGKSVCINTLINCLLYKASPDDVRLIMVDPKMVELNVYNGIPHLLIPVVTDPQKASAALNWACTEMMRRYKLCADVGVRNLDEYNEYLKKQGQKQLYKIVIIIDELADLMLVAKKEVEGHIQRLTQLARAAGIHLIVATQRPSSDVITGVIKSNIPSRIAFSVAQAINSRIILDESGAEKLIGKGDMLVKTVEMDRTLRVQGAFISNDEIKRIVDYIKSDEPNYDMSVIESIENADRDDMAAVGGSAGRGSSDELTDDVIAYIVKSKKASTSLIQRQFQIGYNRAARIIDELEERGIVGPENGAKPRVVLMDKEEWREYTERRMDF